MHEYGILIIDLSCIHPFLHSRVDGKHSFSEKGSLVCKHNNEPWQTLRRQPDDDVCKLVVSFKFIYELIVKLIWC